MGDWSLRAARREYRRPRDAGGRSRGLRPGATRWLSLPLSTCATKRHCLLAGPPAWAGLPASRTAEASGLSFLASPAAPPGRTSAVQSLRLRETSFAAMLSFTFAPADGTSTATMRTRPIATWSSTLSVSTTPGALSPPIKAAGSIPILTLPLRQSALFLPPCAHGILPGPVLERLGWERFQAKVAAATPAVSRDGAPGALYALALATLGGPANRGRPSPRWPSASR